MEISSSTIQDILNAKGAAVIAIESGRSVYEALQLMAARDVGALPVIDDGRLVGMFSERDYARKVILHDRSSRQTLVREIMTPPTVTVGAQDRVSDCMALVTEKRVRHLPVLDARGVIGLVSIGDLVKQELKDHKQLIDLLGQYISGSY